MPGAASGGKLHVISKRYTQRIERHNLNPFQAGFIQRPAIRHPYHHVKG
ncbi:IS1 family transposase [Escherichia coli]